MTDFNKIAQKWQKKWAEKGIFKVKEDPKKKKYYVLEMFPYPSGYLHMGHVRNYSIGDAFARYKRMNGFNVLYPTGYDSLGLPAENAAIKNKSHPKEWTLKCIEMMKQQQKMLGLSYDWDRLVPTMDPEYYRWNQWIFLKLFEKGLAYKKKANVNWCNKCNTVLANEQVHDGKCWRCNTEVDKKEIEQWFFKITEYAEELLEDIKKLEHWPERVKIMQENWIGKSHGVTLKFDVVDENGKKIDEIETYTTRVDTVYGITYLVLAAEHPKVIEWTKGTDKEKEVKKFIAKVNKQSIIERTSEGKEKNGVFLGKYFINPFTGDKCPLWVADYALYEYGTGAVMAVPTHDQRDFEFAKKYKLPLKVVINSPTYDLDSNKMSRAYVDEGVMINSGEFNGSSNRDAMEDIANFAQKKGWGKKTINYKLKDWLISRQRYWGTPIPIIYCDKCGAVPVPDKDLPITLPNDVKFSGKGNPLETSDSFVNTACPKCGDSARRETDTMDTFVDSSWYFFRYCSPKEDKLPFDKKAAKYWMPVDQYIGGIEHACMHLIYARFFTKALRDLGLTNVDEPFASLLCQGMVIKDGAKMSKSLGNTVDPGEIIKKYGPDTARLFILFAALPEKELDWSDQGVGGCFRFLNKVWNLTENIKYSDGKELTNKDKHIVGKLHRTIKKVTELIEEFKLSLAIGAIMEFVSALSSYTRNEVNKEVYENSIRTLSLLLCPFTPHLAEEIWQKFEVGFVSLKKWPEYDESKIDKKAEASEAVIHDTVSDINNVLKLIKVEKPAKISLIVSPKWKYLFLKILKTELEKTRDVKALISVCMAEKDLKPHGKDISKIVPGVLKDLTKLPQTVLDQKTEFSTLEDAKEFIVEEFNCDIEIIKAEDSKEAKAKNASPGKPAILIN
ncbi:leucine--tRNA ligase [Candidatus Woesearchaeota archaeon]|nr:leucine--tRNA ligase [Candidatus Woesearchaeota archaeon]